MTNEQSIKQKIQDLLSSGSTDYGQLLSLSGVLARQDEDHVRFSVDASHISRLGLELVAKQETAVAELVKNGYDADALHVDLIFKDIEQPGGILEITDDGNGMTRQQLVNGFMRISTADKSDNPVSPKYGRQRAGRKGIGRFSAQRLGTKLTVTTQTEDSPHARRVTIDWDQFEANRDLITISNRIETIQKKNGKGTTLLIEDLRDAWTTGQLNRAFRYVASLLQPFPISKREQGDTDEPGFKAAFFRERNGNLEKIVDEEESILEHALAEVWGYVDKVGQSFWSMRCKRYDIEIIDSTFGVAS